MARKRTVLDKRPRCTLCGRSGDIDVKRQQTEDGVRFSACADCRRTRRGLGDKEA